jgi:O-antigen/teichoic acid export membrane protein
MKYSHLLQTYFKLFSSSIFRVAGLFLAFLMSLAVTNTLMIDEAGSFFGAMAIMIFMTVVFRFGLTTYILKIISKECDQTDFNSQAMFVTSLSLVFLTSLPVCIITYLLPSISILSFLEHNSTYLVLITLLPGFVFLSLLTLIASFLQGKSHFGFSILFLNILSQFLFTISVALLPNNSVANAETLGVIYSVSCFISFIIGVIYCKTMFEFPVLRNLDLYVNFNIFPIKSLFQYWIVALGGQWLVWGGQIVASFYLLDSEIAIISIAQRIMLLALFFTTIVNLLYQPKYSKYYNLAHYSSFKKITLDSFKLCIGFGLPFLVVLYFLSPYIFSLFGADYSSSVPIFNILLIGVISSYIFGPCSSILLMTGNERAVSIVSMISALFLLIIGIQASKNYGLNGLAWTISLTFVLQAILNFIIFYKKCWLKITEF